MNKKIAVEVLHIKKKVGDSYLRSRLLLLFVVTDGAFVLVSLNFICVPRYPHGCGWWNSI
jgi:hypothetical protein